MQKSDKIMLIVLFLSIIIICFVHYKCCVCRGCTQTFSKRGSEILKKNVFAKNIKVVSVTLQTWDLGAELPATGG